MVSYGGEISDRKIRSSAQGQELHMFVKMEAGVGIEPAYTDLQSAA